MPRRSTPRIEPKPYKEWDDSIRRLAPGGQALNIFKTLAHHPELMRRWIVFGNHILSKSTLPVRERELAILRIGWLCQSEYEFGQHTRIGLDCGMTSEEIKAVTLPIADGGWSPADVAILTATDELHTDHDLTDETWAALSEFWSPEQLLDFVFTVGQYTLVSMALNTFGVQLDRGVATFPD